MQGTGRKKGALVSVPRGRGQARTRKPSPPPVTAPPTKDAPGPRSAPESTRLRGVIDGVTYQHPGSLYTVLRVTLEPDVETPEGLFGSRGPRERSIHAVGTIGEVEVGVRVALRGEWRTHPKHGPQFHFQSLETMPPVGREGVARYLASKNFKGIGPVLAGRIVEVLGPEALERIDSDPDCLRQVRGLKRASREALVAAVRALRGERELAAFLYGLELNAAQVVEATRVLGPDAAGRIRANPYLLARSVRGVGFASADRAARTLGLAEDSPERRRAALLFALEQGSNDGHTCLELEHLRARTAELLGRPVPG